MKGCPGARNVWVSYRGPTPRGVEKSATDFFGLREKGAVHPSTPQRGNRVRNNTQEHPQPARVSPIMCFVEMRASASVAFGALTPDRPVGGGGRGEAYDAVKKPRSRSHRSRAAPSARWSPIWEVVERSAAVGMGFVRAGLATKRGAAGFTPAKENVACPGKGSIDGSDWLVRRRAVQRTTGQGRMRQR